MEKLANKAANKIAFELSYTEEQKQVLEYGFIALFQTVFMTAAVLLLGAVLNILMESAVLCFAVAILRKYSGGSHARSIASCTIVGVVFCTGFGVVIKSVSRLDISSVTLISASILIFIYAFAVAIRKAPVDSPNKPIKSAVKRKKMKVFTLALLFLYLVISAISVFYLNHSTIFVSLLLCMLLSVAWQMSSLTNPGRILLESMDRLIYETITWKGGHNNEKD